MTRTLSIATALLAGIAILGTATWLLLPTRVILPHDVLPQSTSMLWNNVDTEQARTLATLFPNFSELPSNAAGLAARWNEGNEQRVTVFTAQPNQQPPFRMEGDAIATDPLPSDPLRTDRTYARIAPKHVQSATWLFAREAETTLPIRGALPPFSLTWSGARIEIRTEHTLPIHSTTHVVPMAFDDPALFLVLEQPQQMWEWSKRYLNQEAATLLRILVDQQVHTLLGPQANTEEDVLEPVDTLYVQAQSGTAALILFEAVLPSQRVAEEYADHIMQSALSAIPAIERRRRTFADSFDSDMLLWNEESVQQAEEGMDGWQVRSLQHDTSSTSLFIASRGRSVLLSNSREGVLQRIRSTRSVSIHAAAAGQTNGATWQFIANTLRLPAPIANAEHFSWSIDGDTLVLNRDLFRPMEDAPEQPAAPKTR